MIELKHRVEGQSGANIVLVKNAGILIASGQYSLNDRRISNVLTYYAKPHIESIETHVLPLSALVTAIDFNSKNTDRIKDSLRKLRTNEIEWVIKDEVEGKELEWYTGGFLAEATISQGNIYYAFPPRIRKLLARPARAVAMPLELQTHFSSKNTMAIVEYVFWKLMSEEYRISFVTLVSELKRLTHTNLPPNRYAKELEAARAFLEAYTPVRMKFSSLRDGKNIIGYSIECERMPNAPFEIWRPEVVVSDGRQGRLFPDVKAKGLDALPEDIRAVVLRINKDCKIQSLGTVVDLVTAAMRRGCVLQDFEEMIERIQAFKPRAFGAYTRASLMNLEPAADRQINQSSPPHAPAPVQTDESGGGHKPKKVRPLTFEQIDRTAAMTEFTLLSQEEKLAWLHKFADSALCAGPVRAMVDMAKGRDGQDAFSSPLVDYEVAAFFVYSQSSK